MTWQNDMVRPQGQQRRDALMMNGRTALAGGKTAAFLREIGNHNCTIEHRPAGQASVESAIFGLGAIRGREPAGCSAIPSTGRQMTITASRYFSIAAAAVSGLALGAWLFAAPPAGALVDTTQFISGGSSTIAGPGVTRFTAPGTALTVIPDFPAAGMGEQAMQILTTAGTLSKLRVNVVTATQPTSGTFTLMVRVNGADTVLTCSVTQTGTCSAGHKTKAVANNSRLSIRAQNDLVDSGNVVYTYTMLFD